MIISFILGFIIGAMITHIAIKNKSTSAADLTITNHIIAEDLWHLNDVELLRVLDGLSDSEIALAVRGLSNDLKERIIKERKNVADIIAKDAVVRIVDVDAAQKKMVDWYLILRDNGSASPITVSQGNETSKRILGF